MFYLWLLCRLDLSSSSFFSISLVYESLTIVCSSRDPATLCIVQSTVYVYMYTGYTRITLNDEEFLSQVTTADNRSR